MGILSFFRPKPAVPVRYPNLPVVAVGQVADSEMTSQAVMHLLHTYDDNDVILVSNLREWLRCYVRALNHLPCPQGVNHVGLQAYALAEKLDR